MRKTLSEIIPVAVLAACMIAAPAAVNYAQPLIDALPDNGKDTDKEIRPVENRAAPAARESGFSSGRALRRNSFMLGIGSFGMYSFGGGENHDGFENAGINPNAVLSFSFFVLDGFSLGITALYQYAKTNVILTLPFLPMGFKSTAKAHYGSAGIIAHYFFRITDRFFPYVGVYFHGGMGRVKALRRIDNKLPFIDFGAMAGINCLVIPNLGIFLEVSHTRDVYNPAGGASWGHLTDITLGFKVFL